MADVASLIIRVTANGVDRASASLGSLGKAALAAGAAIGGLEAAKGVFDSLVASQRNFDKLNAGLVTMTGSAENAGKAFAILQQFAKDTPYGLNQAVEGFTKLVALGLNPSREALISYGNTAAAMGKDLNQMIEAVADASTFEFERLKEFGIKSSQQADTVSFTFRGVTTTVKKNSEEIQKYLLNIGNTDFAGAMEQRANSLDGVLSSLEDSFDALVLSVARSGFGDLMAAQAQKAEVAVQELTDTITSGELMAEIKDWVTLFNDSFTFISDLLNSLAMDTDQKSADMSDSLNTIPDAIREWLPEIQQTFYELIAWFQRIDDYAVALGNTLADVFDPSKTASITFKNMIKQADDAYDATLKASKAQADAIRQQSAERRKAAEEQRKQYDQQQQHLQKQALQDLVPKTGGTGDTGSGKPDTKAINAAKAAAKLAEQQRKQAADFIDTVKRQNSDELAAIDEQEKQKLAKLDAFRQQGALKEGEYEATKTQIALDAEADRAKLLKQRADEAKKKQDSADSYIEQLRAQNEGELAEIDRQSEEKLKKLDEFYAAGLIKEKDYQAAVKDIQEDAEKAKSDVYRGALGDMTDNLATALGEGNALYKAAAITQTIIDTYKGAQAAFSALAPIPIVGPALGTAAAAAAIAAGMARIGKIRSAREQGGSLSAGQATTIAERGQAEVIMPASASRVRTAQQMRQIMGEDRKSSNTGGVVIVNQTTGRIDSVQQETDDEGRLRILIRETVSGDMQDSNSQISASRRSTRNQPGF